MKKKYMSPELDYVSIRTQEIMDQMNPSDPHIPTEGGDDGEDE